MRRHNITALATLLICGTAQALSRTEVLECSLQDGSKFVMSAKHDWDPLSALSPHISERLEQENFSVTFQRKKSRKKILMPNTSSYQSLQDVEVADSLCLDMGVLGGVTYYGRHTYLPPGAKAFIETQAMPQLHISSARVEQPPAIAARLTALDASPSVSAFNASGSPFVAEMALTGADMTVVAVYQSTSHDRGATWSEPVITDKAAIFTIGVPVTAHPFIARASRINGKRVDRRGQ